MGSSPHAHIFTPLRYSHCVDKPVAMAPKKQRTTHTHEAPSSRAHVSSLSQPAILCQRTYMKVTVAHACWEVGTPMPWPDVNLPHGWHLGLDRVPVPPVLAFGCARRAVIQRYPAPLLLDRDNPAYKEGCPTRDLWFTHDHDTRRCTYFVSRAPAREALSVVSVMVVQEEEVCDTSKTYLLSRTLLLLFCL
jgi:hypothetical protein